MIFTLTAALAAVATLLLLAAIAVLIYAFKDGTAFFYTLYFYFVPAACLFLLCGGAFAIARYVRYEARRLKPIAAQMAGGLE